MRHLLLYSGLLLLCLYSTRVQAQLVIQSEQTADLEVCKEGQSLDLKLIATETLTGLINLDFALPQGINTEPEGGAVMNSSATIFAADYTDLQNPAFVLELNEELLPGQSIHFSLIRKAHCTSIELFQDGGIFEDIIRLSFDGGEIEDFGSSYELLYAALSIVVPEPEFFAAGVADTQRVEIFNGGLACVDSLYYHQTSQDSNIELLGVYLNSVALLHEIEENELYVPINASALVAAGYPACLPAGTSITIELIKIAPSCTPAINLNYVDSVEWGCMGQACNSAQAQTSSILVTDQDEYLQDLIVDWQVENLDDCGTMQHTIELTDPLFPSSAAIAITSLQLGHRPSLYSSYSRRFNAERISLDSVSINGVATQYLNDSGLKIRIKEEMGFVNTEQGNLLIADSTHIIRFQTGIDYGAFPLDPEITGCPQFQFYYKFVCTEEIGTEFSFSVSSYESRLFNFNDHEAIYQISEDTGLDFSFDLEFLSERKCTDSYIGIAFDFDPGFDLMQDGHTGVTEDGQLLFADYDEEQSQIATAIDTSIFNNLNIFGTVDCELASGGEHRIPYEIRQYCGLSTCQYDIILRDTIQQFLLCDSNEGGSATGSDPASLCLGGQISRKSFGWTDETMSTKVTPATVEDIALYTAATGDTIEVEAIFNPACMLEPEINLSYKGLMEDQSPIRFLSASLHDMQGALLATIDPDLVQLANDSLYNSELECIKINLADAFMQSNSGESGLHKLLIQCTVAEDHPAEKHILSPIFSSFLNLDSTRNRNYYPEFHTLGYTARIAEFRQIKAVGCGRHHFEYTFRWNYEGKEDHFPFEYRPLFRFDTLSIDLPTGLHSPEFQHGDWQLQELELQFDSIVMEDKVRYRFFGFHNFQAPDLALDNREPDDNQFDFGLIFSVGCPAAFVVESELCYTTNLYHRDNALAQKTTLPIEMEISESINQNSQLFGNATLTAFEWLYGLPIVFCDVFAEEDQQYTFLRFFDNEEDLIDFDPEEQYPTLDDGSKIIQLGTQSLLECTEDLVLPFEYRSCNTGSQVVYYGYSCEEDITSLSQICEMSQTVIEVDPKQAEVQFGTSEPIGSQLLCDTLDYTFTVASARQAAIINPVIEVELPSQGLALFETAWLEYPIGTDWRAFQVVVSEQNLAQFDLATIDAAAGGLGNIDNRGIPGIFNSFEEERQARIHVKVIPGCAFVSGSQARATVYANRVCGEPAIGNSITELLQPLLIDAALPLSSTVATIEERSVNFCDETAILDAQLIFEHYSPESIGLQCAIRFPEGASLIEESLQYDADKIMSWNTEVIANQQELFLETSANINSGDMLDISFELDLSQHFCNGTATEYYIRTTEDLEVLCTASNSLCNLAVKNSLGSGYNEMILPRFEPEMSGTAIAECEEEDTKVVLDLDLSEYDLQTASTEDYELAVYLDKNENSIVDGEDQLLDRLQLQNYTIINTEIHIVDQLFVELLDSQLLLRLETVDENLCVFHCEELSWPMTVEFEDQWLIEGSIWLDSNGDGQDNEQNAALPQFHGMVSISEGSTQLGTAAVTAGHYSFLVDGPGEYLVEAVEGQFVYSTGDPVSQDLDLLPVTQYLDGSCASARSFNIPVEVPCQLEVLDRGHNCLNEGENVAYQILFGQFAAPLNVLLNGEHIATQNEGAVSVVVPGAEPFAIQVVDALGCLFTLATIVDCLTLPIELISFRATAEPDHNLVAWTVASEEDLDSYLLERSIDGSVFERIAQISSRNLSGTEVYQVQDHKLDSETYYYRLSTISNDAAKSAIGFTTIQRSADAAMVLQVLDGRLEISSVVPGKASFFDLHGREMFTQELDHMSTSIDISGLPPGLYFFSCQGLSVPLKLILN